MKGVKIVHISSKVMHRFLTSDDMQDGASDRLQFLLKYYEMVKYGPKIFLVHFVSFLVYALQRLMSCAPRFYQMKDIRYISVVSFISKAFVLLKLKFFLLIQHLLNGPFFRVFR